MIKAAFEEAISTRRAARLKNGKIFKIILYGSYLSVKLDDPSFPAPIYASLVEVDGGHSLIWSR
ncbi:hypothetical protein D3C80_1929240 [compost metagenome]